MSLNFYNENEFGVILFERLKQFNDFSKSLLYAFQDSYLWNINGKKTIFHKDVYENRVLIDAVIHDRNLPESDKHILIHILKSRKDGRLQFEFPFSSTHHFRNEYIEDNTAFNDAELFKEALKNSLESNIRYKFLSRFNEYVEQQPIMNYSYYNSEEKPVIVSSKIRADARLAYRFLNGKGAFLINSFLGLNNSNGQGSRLESIFNIEIMLDNQFYKDAPQSSYLGDDRYYPRLFLVLLFLAIIDAVVDVAKQSIEALTAAINFVKRYYDLSDEDVTSLESLEYKINRFTNLYFSFFTNL